MQQLIYHENLETLHVGTLPNHAYFIPHETAKALSPCAAPIPTVSCC